jgi:hypothetical protein
MIKKGLTWFHQQVGEPIQRVVFEGDKNNNGIPAKLSLPVNGVFWV